uniref:Cell division cycle associated 9 n=1 Tax=Nothobranchius korthausae TaxID=1143690 RepID=A0A1A8H4S3_9TELE
MSSRSSSTTIKIIQSRLTNLKTREQMNQRKPTLRSVVSAGELPCSMAGSAAHVTVTTTQRQEYIQRHPLPVTGSLGTGEHRCGGLRP